MKVAASPRSFDSGRSCSGIRYLTYDVSRRSGCRKRGDARLRIILAPSSGRGRRAKRGGVGIPACENTTSRSQPPPLRGTSFQRKAGEKRTPLTGNYGSEFRALVAASLRSITRSQLFWHSYSHIWRFSPLRMAKRGDARRSADGRLPVLGFHTSTATRK